VRCTIGAGKTSKLPSLEFVGVVLPPPEPKSQWKIQHTLGVGRTAPGGLTLVL